MSPVSPHAASARCQWCHALLPADARVCPACGAAVPTGQSAMSLPEETVTTLLGLSPESKPAPRATPTDPLIELAILGLSLLVGVAIGWLLFPLPLAALFQGLLGVPAQPSDLGRLGALLGGLAGLGVGATVRLVFRRDV